MSAPKRIQMSRQRPWRADNPDAVIVARPSKWGNPYRIGDRTSGLVCNPGAVTGAEWEWEDRISAAGMRHDFFHPGDRVTRCTIAAMTAAQAVILYREALTGVTEHIREPRWARVGKRDNPLTVADVRAELAGRDLACWCPLGSPCHGDVLLELANPEPAVPMDPDCRDNNKHAACSGSAWDDDLDCLTDCACACHRATP